MHTYIRTITEEIEFYQRRNFRFQMEDLLREIEGKKKINKKKINENEIRIERLLDYSIKDFL